MEVGGHDTTFELPSDWAVLEACDHAVGVVESIWPDAAIEVETLDGELIRCEQRWDIPYRNAYELFLFKSERHLDEWNERGAEPDLLATMVHLCLRPGQFGVVVGDRSPQSITFESAIATAVGEPLRIGFDYQAAG